MAYLKCLFIWIPGLLVSLSACESESDDPSNSSVDCRGPGRYESGKEGSYLPCCSGLTEVFYKKAGYSDGQKVCTDFPLRVYACVSGRCGDGICEEGEAEPCGCVDDCPSAVWESQSVHALNKVKDVVGERCDSIINQSDAPYPGRSVSSPDETAEFEQRAAEFRAFYSDVSERYWIEPKLLTTSPNILLVALRSGPGIQLLEGSLGIDRMTEATNDFVEQWTALLNPYDVEIVGQEPSQDEYYIYRDFQQSYCGLDIGSADQHDYTGTLHFVADPSSAVLLTLNSNLVPLVPLPPAVLDPSDVGDMLVGVSLGETCSGEPVVSQDPCIIEEARKLVFVRPIPDVTELLIPPPPEALEYRLSYEVELSPNGCEPEPSWIVIIDAIDGMLIHAKKIESCPIIDPIDPFPVSQTKCDQR